MNFKNLYSWSKDNKANIFRYSLVFLLLFTCITDIATFFYSGLYEFEINPIVIALKTSIGFGWAIALAVILKALIIILVAQSMAFYKPKKNGSHYGAYMIVYLAFFCILLQVFGTYSNINTTIEFEAAPPGEVVPLETGETVKLLNIVNVIWYIITLTNLLIFYLYEQIFRRPLCRNT